MRRVRFGWVFIILLAACEDQKRLESVIVFPQADKIPEFSLTDHEGKPFNRTNFKGRRSLLFFGFGHCPDVCPVTLALLAKVGKKLILNHKTPPKVYMITLDPERDTPEFLKTYVSHFDHKFTGLTGDKSELAKLYKKFGVAFEIANETEKGDYLINHSAAIYLLDAKARYIGILPPPHDAEKISRDLANFNP